MTDGCETYWYKNKYRFLDNKLQCYFQYDSIPTCRFTQSQYDVSPIFSKRAHRGARGEGGLATPSRPLEFSFFSLSKSEPVHYSVIIVPVLPASASIACAKSVITALRPLPFFASMKSTAACTFGSLDAFGNSLSAIIFFTSSTVTS